MNCEFDCKEKVIHIKREISGFQEEWVGTRAYELLQAKNCSYVKMQTFCKCKRPLSYDKCRSNDV